MAITSGVGPHFAFLNVSGLSLPIEHGSVTQSAKRKTSSFSCSLPMSYPGAAAGLSDLGDNEATISVSTRGQTGTLITGEVDVVEYDFIRRVIKVSGRDKSAKLHEIKSSEKHVNKMPSDIVTEMIGRAGLSGNVTASTLMSGKKLEQDFVHLTDNVSLAYVIHKLSQMDGARWWVDPNGMFHYVPMGTPVGSYSISVNQNVEPISSDCLELRVVRNVQAGKSVAVTVKSWHPKLKNVASSTATNKGNGGPVMPNYHIPSSDMEHVKRHAKSKADEYARHEFTVSATVVGDVSVQAGMGLTLNWTNYFDQTFDIDTVQHDFGMPGHLTHITARSAKTGRSSDAE